MLKNCRKRRSALMLIWGIAVSCQGFATKALQVRADRIPRRTLPNRRDGQPLIRGGAVDSRLLRERTDGVVEDPPPARNRGMSAALAATYFTVMASKCALPAVLAQLTNPKTGLKFSKSLTSSHQALFARLLAISTISIAAGKLLLGPVIDYFGGIFSLKMALSILALLLGIISCANSFITFAVCWVVVDFIFSSCWAACINSIHQSFPEKVWASKIGMLAAAARTGNAAAFAFFAWILAVAGDQGLSQPWRVVFAASCLIQTVPVALLSYYGGKIQESKKSYQQAMEVVMEGQQSTKSQTTLKASLRTLQREAKTPAFWLHLMSRSVLMVFASFLLFVPLLMSQAYGTSPSTAALSGSIYAIGCLLSVTFGSKLYATLPYTKKAVSVAILLGLSTISSAAHLGHMTGTWKLSTSACAALWFVWGYSFSIPFYLPPSLYALAKGGVDSSATIADVFDIGGFGLLAFFNAYVADINHAKLAAWIPTFQLTTACSAIALVCLTSAILLEGSSDEKPR